MIHFLFVHLFYGKRRILLYLALCIIPLVIYMLTNTGVSNNQELLYQEAYQFYFEEIAQKMLILIVPFFIVIISMDHDQPYLKTLFAYFGRFHLLFSKLILYLIMLTWLYSAIFILYHVIPFFFTSYYQLLTFNLSFFFDLYLDGILLMIFVFTWIKDRHKAFSVIFPILYILISLYQEDHQSLSIFYMFPIHFPSISMFYLAYPYKLCYILLVLVLSVKKMLSEQI